MRPDPIQSLHDRVVARLVNEHGWHIRRDRPFCSLVKEFATAVGPKEASLVLQGRQDSIRLWGCYESQGRNVLSPGPFPDSIHLAVDDEALNRQVDAWNASASKDIDASYARRLYVEFGIESDRPRHSIAPTSLCATCANA